jgi:hypothetical protein
MSLAILVINTTKASHLHMKKRKASAVFYNSLTVLSWRTADWRNDSLAEMAGFDSRRHQSYECRGVKRRWRSWRNT